MRVAVALQRLIAKANGIECPAAQRAGQKLVIPVDEAQQKRTQL
jgi:hypothetical protein